MHIYYISENMPNLAKGVIFICIPSTRTKKKNKITQSAYHKNVASGEGAIKIMCYVESFL